MTALDKILSLREQAALKGMVDMVKELDELLGVREFRDLCRSIRMAR